MDLNYIFKNDRIRVLGDYLKPLIPVVDVADEIGDQNYRRYVGEAALPDDVVVLIAEDSAGRKQPIHVFTEEGVYRYLIRSNLPKALEYQRYVFGVLKELRTKGVAQFEARLSEHEHRERVQKNLINFLKDQNSSLMEATRMLEKAMHLLNERARLLARSANTPYKYEEGDDAGHLAERYIDHFVYRFKYYAPKKRSKTSNNVWRLPEDFDITAVDRKIIEDIHHKAAQLFRLKNEEVRNDEMWAFVRKQLDHCLVAHEKDFDDPDCDD